MVIVSLNLETDKGKFFDISTFFSPVHWFTEDGRVLFDTSTDEGKFFDISMDEQKFFVYHSRTTTVRDAPVIISGYDVLNFEIYIESLIQP